MNNTALKNKNNKMVKKYIKYHRPDVYAVYYNKSRAIYYNISNDSEEKLILFINN